MDYVEFIAKAAQDKDYRARIKANPEQVLEEAGATLNGAKVQVVEDTAATHHVVMPLDPNTALEDEILEEAVGGTGHGGCNPLDNWQPFPHVSGCLSCANSPRPFRHYFTKRPDTRESQA